MSAPKIEESEPLFWAYGHAVFAAQLLEHGVQLLLKVFDQERQKSGLPSCQLDLDDPKSHQTLGTLFSEVLKVEFVTEAEKKTIWKAIQDRNILVHSYWGEKHTLATFTPQGRQWLIADLLQRKERCRNADRIISSMIDQYLSKYGVSIESLSAPEWDKWQNDEAPPDNVLH